MGRWAIGLSMLGLLASGCGGGSQDSVQGWDPPVPPPVLPTRGTGTLTVLVADPDGRPIEAVSVKAFNTQLSDVAAGLTGADGQITLASLPTTLIVFVESAFGSWRSDEVRVAPQGTTSLSVTLTPSQPSPMLALLPAEIPADRISADRGSMTLRLTFVALPGNVFYGPQEPGPNSQPSIRIELGDQADYSPNICWWWFGPDGGSECDRYNGPSASIVESDEYRYEPAGTVPMPSPAGTRRSAMLVLDQGWRVSALDPNETRTFASRRFVERVLGFADAIPLSIAGVASSAGNPPTPRLLPQQPLWSPSGSAAFSSDADALKSAIGLLEPLVGGSSGLFAGIDAALTQTNAAAPAGHRSVVILASGEDELATAAAARAMALAALRQQRDATGVHPIVIDASPAKSRAGHRGIADLAAALRAPTISLGVSTDERGFYAQSWASGSTAALRLAADLVAGAPLPTLTMSLRVSDRAGTFTSGSTVRGIAYIDTQFCPMDCWELPIAFTAIVP